MINRQLVLRRLSPANVRTIKRWPRYPKEVRALDYALRRGGWLDAYPESPTTLRFGAWRGSRLVGFSILTDITSRTAEFYVALHPREIGHGVGRQLTARTLEYAFATLELQRVYLKVRIWHRRAITLYASVGFVRTRRKTEPIQGTPVRFQVMEIRKKAFKAN